MITDGEQRKYHNFWTYCVQGLPNTAPDGFKIPFSAGHTRRMPRLTAGPFRYTRHADSYLDVALRYAHVPVKQAVISPSALSLMYPADEIPGYPREQFIDDLLREHETEVRNCLRKGAHKVQIDFTEGRLAVKIDPTGDLLHSFIDLNNLALSRFSAEDRKRIGVHTCPGSDRDSTHSGEVDYAELLPSLFELKVGNFYIALAGEKDRVRVLKIIRRHLKAEPSGLRRRRLADRPARRDPGGGPGPGPGSGPVHPGRATRHDRRLRLLAVLRRHVHDPRHGIREDPGARGRAPRWPRQYSEAVDGGKRRRGGTAPLGRPAERPEHPLRAPCAEEALRKQSEWLRITLASIGDAVISTDAEGRVTFMNGVAEALTGWPQAEALGRPLPEVFHIVNERTRQPVENPALRALREGTIVGLANHTVLIARDGTERPIDDSAAPMRDEGGAALGAVLVFRDVTERKRAEEARARLAAIIESSEDAIVSKTLDGVIRSWNAGAERLFGYTAEEAVGRSITLIIPPERLDEERAILERLRRGERVEHFETVRVAKDGRRLDISLTISPIRDGAGHIIGASKIARDITERKRAEDALRESEARYRQAATEAARTAEANAKFRAFFEQGTNFAGVLTLDGTVVEANRLCLDACGFTPRRGHRQAVLGVRLVEPLGSRDGDGPDGLPPGSRGRAVPHRDRLLRGRRYRAGGGPHPRPRDGRGGPRPLRGRHRDRRHGPAADGGRAAGAGPAQGRVPRPAGPRAAQPAGPAAQRPAGDAAGGRRRRRRRPGPGHDGAAARAHGAAHRRPARHLPHQPQQDGAPPVPGAAGRRRQQRRGDRPAR